MDTSSSVTPPQARTPRAATSNTDMKTVPIRVPELRYLRELSELQEIRVKIQNDFDYRLRVPATGYLREVKLLFRVLVARVTWYRRVAKALEQKVEMQVAPPVRRGRLQCVSTLRSLDERRNHLWEILEREFDLEVEQGVLHPRGWTVVRELFNLIEQMLELRRDSGLLGVDLDSIDDDEPSTKQLNCIEAVAC